MLHASSVAGLATSEEVQAGGDRLESETRTMSEHDRKQENKETGFRHLFVESLPPTPTPAEAEVVEIMTLEELARRFLALPIGILATRRLNKAITALAIDVTRSHAALLEMRRCAEAALKMIALSQRAAVVDADGKAWVLDQVARILAGDQYGEFVAIACAGPAGPATYSWDVGIAP